MTSSLHDLQLILKGLLIKIREEKLKISDNVNHPSHYNESIYEVIDVIQEWKLGFELGNAIKYIARAGYKTGQTTLDDLKKARWYLNRRIALIEEEMDSNNL